MQDLDERKRKILKAIIQTYLETGEPVGSRTMNWKELWRTLFETCEWLRFNMGFRRIKPKNK